VAVQLDASPVIAVLHIENNDITLLKMGPNAIPGVGVAVLRSPQDDTSMIVMTGNRIVCADVRSLAAALFFPTLATVTGNMFIHSEPTVVIGGPGQRVFSSIGLETGAYAYTGNVFVSGAYIVPARTAPQPTPDWSFLNTGA
jgi:hypothetical protein